MLGILRANAIATSGTNTLRLKLPLTVKVLQTYLINETKGWQRQSLSLVPENGSIGFSLVHQGIQPGDRVLYSNKEFTIQDPLVELMGSFSNCDASDDLWVGAVYEY